MRFKVIPFPSLNSPYAFIFVSDTPKKYVTLHWIVWVTSWTGIIGLLISHGHYTIDVIIGYYATTRLFWIYHALANRAENKVMIWKMIVKIIFLIK